MLFLLILLLYSRVHENFYSIIGFLKPTLLFILLSLLYILIHNGISSSKLKPFVKGGICKYYLYILVISVLGIPFSTYPAKSFFFLVEFFLQINLISILLLNLSIIDDRVFQKVWDYLLATLCIANVLCIIRPIGSERFSVSYTMDPNDFALYVAMTCAFLYPRMPLLRCRMRKWLFRLVIPLSLVSITLTQSRGGILAALGVVLYYGFSRGVKRGIKTILLVILCAFLATALFGPERFERFSSIIDYKEDYNMDARDGRIEVWKRGLQMIADNPLTGVGLKAFAVAEGQMGIGKWSSAHNSFIEIGAELGVFGLICFLLMLNAAFRVAKPADESDWVGQGIRLALVAYVVGGFFLSWAYNYVLYFMLTLAMIRERLQLTDRRPSRSSSMRRFNADHTA